MTASIFIHANVKPTIVVGGKFDMIKSTALLGDGDWLIAEADESDGSFNRLSPEISIITNVDSDHLDYYKSFENLQKAFQTFALKTPFYGFCIVCGDDPQVKKLFENFSKPIVFYGFDEKNDFVIKGSNGKYRLFENTPTSRKELGEFELKVPGAHNALNATAAIIAGLRAGFAFNVCKEGLAKFEGVDRRFHYKGDAQGIRVYDDYGHHPTEVKATLAGFREKFPDQRLVVMFQPHRISRTESCWHDFTLSFSQCDELILTDIYAAGEASRPGITSEKLASEIKHDNCKYWPKNVELADRIISILKKGDIFITLGAGDGWKVGQEVLDKLKGQK